VGYRSGVGVQFVLFLKTVVVTASSRQHQYGGTERGQRRQVELAAGGEWFEAAGRRRVLTQAEMMLYGCHVATVGYQRQTLFRLSLPLRPINSGDISRLRKL